MPLDQLIIYEVEKRVEKCARVLKINTNQEIKVAALKFGYKNKLLI